MTTTRSKYVSAETKEKRRQSTKRWRLNKKKINWNGNKKAVGKSTRTVFSFEDVQNIIGEWSEKVDNLTKKSKHDELRNYIRDVSSEHIFCLKVGCTRRNPQAQFSKFSWGSGLFHFVLCAHRLIISMRKKCTKFLRLSIPMHTFRENGGRRMHKWRVFSTL